MSLLICYQEKGTAKLVYYLRQHDLCCLKSEIYKCAYHPAPANIFNDTYLAEK